MAEKTLCVWVVVKEPFVQSIAKETLYHEVVCDKAVGTAVKKQPEIGCADQYYPDTVLA